MTLKKTVVLTLMLMLLTNCGWAATRVDPTVQSVDESVVTRSLGYVDAAKQDEGPRYDVSVELPDEWVGRVQTRETPNVIYFDYDLGDGQLAQLFTIEALSERQWWMQVGSNQSTHEELINQDGTVFVYNVAADPYFVGVPDEEYDAFLALVPAAMSSFSVSPAATVAE